ncbi:protein disulfide-isomerase TMX3 isoform X3, partial [Ixodes scapularis]
VVCAFRVGSVFNSVQTGRMNSDACLQFYAPLWGGHCKMLEPIWSQVAQNLVDTDIRVARVDCTWFTSVATEFSVRGFPTVLLWDPSVFGRFFLLFIFIYFF